MKDYKIRTSQHAVVMFPYLRFLCLALQSAWKTEMNGYIFIDEDLSRILVSFLCLEKKQKKPPKHIFLIQPFAELLQDSTV